MHRLSDINNIFCSLIPGASGDLQIVRTPGAQSILIDVQSASPDVFGRLRHAHSTLKLGFDAVCELRALLDEIGEPHDDRQPSLPAIWSEATFTQPVRALRRQRHRRAA
jgi:hypothetical protein